MSMSNKCRPSKRSFLSSKHHLTIDEYFNLLLPSLTNINNNKTTKDVNILYDYLFYLDKLVEMIKKLDPKKYKELLHSLATCLTFQEIDSDTILFRQGEKGSLFYIILKGTVDILLQKEKSCKLMEASYLRYLAFLIGYYEYDLVNRVINLNVDTFPVTILNASFGKLNRTSSLGISPLRLTLDDLFDMLTKKEKIKFKDGFRDVEQAGMEITEEQRQQNRIKSSEYISRIMAFEDYISDEKPDPNKMKDLKIIEYFVVISLSTGNIFGEKALLESSSKRTSTILCPTKCYFGCLNKDDYNSLLKELQDMIQKEVLKTISSIYIFKDTSIDSIQKKYYNYFVIETKKKGDKLLIENEFSDKVIILKDGEYEISMLSSMNNLSEIINNLHSMIAKPSYEYTDEEAFIVSNVKKMNAEDKRLYNRAEQHPGLNKFLKGKESYSLSMLNTPDIIGLKDTYKDKGINFFTYELKSLQGESYSIKREIFDQIVMIDSSIRRYQKEYTTQKIYKMLSRLLLIRLNKLKCYFIHNPDHFYFSEYSEAKLDLFNDVLKLKSSHKDNIINAKETIVHIDKLNPCNSASSIFGKRRAFPRVKRACGELRSLGLRELNRGISSKYSGVTLDLVLFNMKNKIPITSKYIKDKDIDLQQVNNFKASSTSPISPTSDIMPKHNNRYEKKESRPISCIPGVTPKKLRQCLSHLRSRKIAYNDSQSSITCKQNSMEFIADTTRSRNYSLVKYSYWTERQGMREGNIQDKRSDHMVGQFNYPFELPDDKMTTVSATSRKLKRTSSSMSIYNYAIHKKKLFIEEMEKDNLKRTLQMYMRNKVSNVALIKKF